MGVAQTGCVLLFSHRASQVHLDCVFRRLLFRVLAPYVHVDTTPDGSTGFEKISDPT
jgi:hypothetical protein